MVHKDLAELLKTQKSLTEWLEDIKHKDTDAIRQEDNEKRERLKILNEVIGLPFDKPEQFECSELVDRSPRFKKFLSQNSDKLCALRLIPKEPGLEKLRMRGRTVAGALEWFEEQKISAGKYRADFIPHSEHSNWATIFIVNSNGIQGEIIRGGHHQLTQGFHEESKPFVFRFDFKKWTIFPVSKEALAHLKRITAMLLVDDAHKKDLLKEFPGATFSHGFLEGYFETTDSDEFGSWFIDYSPYLGRLYGAAVINFPQAKGDYLVKGLTASPGRAQGPVHIVERGLAAERFPTGGILVCSVTTPEFVPFMQKSAAIITDQGGILSHAAIVARELKVPCIVATGDATKILNNGQLVMVDADKGTVVSA